MQPREKLSQRERILNLLRERGNAGVRVWELIAPRPTGLGIAQYGARIKELREQGFNIINVKPGYFILKAEPKFRETPIINGRLTNHHQLMFV